MKILAEVGNNDTYTWGQINRALVNLGWPPARIADVAIMLNKVKKNDKETYGKPKKKDNWTIHGVFDDLMDAKNSVQDFESQGDEAKIEDTGTGWAVYYR